MQQNCTDKSNLMEGAYRIPDGNLRYAYRYLVEIAAGLQEFCCEADEHADSVAFCLCEKATGLRPFRISTGSDWLLFTFRDDATRSTAFSLRELQGVFGSAYENSVGEWTVRVRTQEDVDRLLHFIGWCNSGVAKVRN